MTQVKENNTVKVNYTGKLADGQIFDSSEGKEPLEKTITIAKDEAYGDVNTTLIQEVDKEQLPQDMAPEVGMGLVSKSPDGQEINLLVVEVKDKTIVVDGNHPLAGKDLVFDLEVLEIK